MNNFLIIFLLDFMDDCIIYVVEKGLIEGFELGVEICLQTTDIGAVFMGISGRISGILMGRDKQETKLFGWQRWKVTSAAHTPHSPGSPGHTQIP